jgi:beta-lactamase class A
MTTLAPAALALLASASPTPALEAAVRDAVASCRCEVRLFAKNLDTGAAFGLGADDPVRTASTIKLAVMVEAFDRVARGAACWEEPLTLTADSKVSGAGILPEFAPGLRLTLRDAVHLMIVLSDNTATNLVVDRLGADAVNERMDALGFPQTRLMRKVMGGGDSRAGLLPENKRFGLGRTTPREMVTLLERLERGQLVSKDASAEMIGILKRQQYRDGVGRTLVGVEIANKTGALDRLRSDVAIVYSERGRIAMAITVDDLPEVVWNTENPGLLLLSRLSLALLDGLGAPPAPAPSGRSSRRRNVPRGQGLMVAATATWCRFPLALVSCREESWTHLTRPLPVAGTWKTADEGGAGRPLTPRCGRSRERRRTGVPSSGRSSTHRVSLGAWYWQS